MTDDQLRDESELLLSLEVNNGNSMVELDFQGETSSGCGSADNADGP